MPHKMLRLLGIAVVAFNAWMLADAYRRRAETYWLWIIAIVPGGALAYFIFVRSRAPDLSGLRQRLTASMKRPPSVAALRRRAQETPSIAHRLALAQGLTDAGEYREARAGFEGVLAERAHDNDALYGRGVCALELDDLDAASDSLTQVVDDAPMYRDFAAWPELAETFYRQGKQDVALELLSTLVRRAPRLTHYMLLARLERRYGRTAQAEAALVEGLKVHSELGWRRRVAETGVAQTARRQLAEMRQRRGTE